MRGSCNDDIIVNKLADFLRCFPSNTELHNDSASVFHIMLNGYQKSEACKLVMLFC